MKVESEAATISTNLTGPLTAVYPYKAAGMSDSNPNQIDTVLVSTEQDGKFASANICIARMTSENDESLSFENKTAVFCIYPPTDNPEYVEVSAEGFDIANHIPTGSTNTDYSAIRVPSVTTDSVYVSILVPDGLTIGNLKFSDGTKEKAITTGAQATEEIAAGTLYTVTATDWESPEADTPEGALAGVFSVSADKQVRFSQGNLWADDSNALHFESDQYSSASSWDASHVSHFTWSSTVEAAVGDSNSGDNLFCDESHKVSVDGGDAIYYALSKDEWSYLFNNHTKKWASVNGKSGYVIAPDGFTGEIAISYADDAALASAGNLVFLPAAGSREGFDVDGVGDIGYYWSSTALNSRDAYFVGLNSDAVFLDYGVYRSGGVSVRLITDVPVTPASTAPEGFVDLGVKNDAGEPLYWAECNLGATNAWDYGKYFSWGDVKGQTPTDNTFSNAFSWDNDVFGATFDKISKATACPNGILAPDYDAATAENPSWRTPTKDEFVNLAANCVWSWCDGDIEKYKGTKVPGYIVYKAKNENDEGKAYINNTWMRWDSSQSSYVTEDASAATGTYIETDPHIFFPAAGGGNGTSLSNVGSNGSYWSSSFNPSIPNYAYSLGFASSGVYPQGSANRYGGFSIRPVASTPAEGSTADDFNVKEDDSTNWQ